MLSRNSAASNGISGSFLFPRFYLLLKFPLDSSSDHPIPVIDRGVAQPFSCLVNRISPLKASVFNEKPSQHFETLISQRENKVYPFHGARQTQDEPCWYDLYLFQRRFIARGCPNHPVESPNMVQGDHS